MSHYRHNNGSIISTHETHWTGSGDSIIHSLDPKIGRDTCSDINSIPVAGTNEKD